MANEVSDVDIRLIYGDAGETRMDTVFEANGVRLNPGVTTPTTDPRLLPIVPKTKGFLGEDDKLFLYAKSTTTTHFDENGELEIPVTIRNVKTGVVNEKMLQRADFFATGVAMVVNIWTKIGYYTVGAQEQLKIGHAIAENSRIRVVTRNA